MATNFENQVAIILKATEASAYAADIKKVIDSVTADYLALQKSNEDISKELDDTKQELKVTEQLNEELTAQVTTLSNDVDASKATPVKSLLSEKTFEYDGHKYGFAIHAVRLNGEVIKPDDVLADPALQKALIEMKSSFLKEL